MNDSHGEKAKQMVSESNQSVLPSTSGGDIEGKFSETARQIHVTGS
jgi:hypothetical protein